MAQATSKLRGMSPDELDREEQELRGEIWKLRLQITTGQLQDPHKVRRVRKDLARLLTVKRELERQAENGAGR
jgi:large subunit ribosomal protein L29